LGEPVKRTGTIWRKRWAVRDQIVEGVCQTLHQVYGAPRLGNPKDSLDDLVYIVVSNKTSPGMARLTYRRFKERFASWERVVTSGGNALRSILRPAGLSSVKSRQLKAALHQIRRDFGTCDLRGLKRKTEPEIREYLTSLPGVSDKVARCVMMYTMGARVLPVDAHVHRVAVRLGWTARKRADQCHEELESLVPPTWRYIFHVGCVLHGREICRPNRPLCESCCLNRYCEYFKKSRKLA
jgi:endonuclease III